MAITIEEYKNKVINTRRHIYSAICNICCLEHNTFFDIEKCKYNLYISFLMLYDPCIKYGVSKEKVLKRHLIKEINDDLFIKAMKYEIAQAKKRNYHRKHKEAEYIQKHIIPNISKYRKANAERIKKLIQNLISSIINLDFMLLDDSLQEFYDNQ